MRAHETRSRSTVAAIAIVASLAASAVLPAVSPAAGVGPARLAKPGPPAPRVGLASAGRAAPGRAAAVASAFELPDWVIDSGYPLGDCRYGERPLPSACANLYDYVFGVWRPFSGESPFNRPVPDSPRLTRNSASVVDRLTGFGSMQKVLEGVAGTEEDWSHPIYYAYADDPVFTVHCSRSADWGTCEIEGARVRIPDAAQPAAGGDGHMAVIDVAPGPGYGSEYDFWQVKSKPDGGGRLVASYGGRTSVLWQEADGLGSNATAANYGLSAGIVRPEELEAGRIDHALFMVVRCTNGDSVWPAPESGTGRPCSQLGLPDSGAPAMGQRFYLDMSDAQIAALPEPAWKKTILRAMARYGALVGDTGGGSWGIQFQSSASYTSFGYPDPWVRLARRWGVPSWESGGRTLYAFDLGDAVDWGARLSVVAPCEARGTC